MKDRVALWLAGLTTLLHVSVANRYDIFRDELYFIVCGRHPQFGYADQPPLVPFIAAGSYALGAQTWLLRLTAVLAAGALVYLAVRFARLLGGGTTAAVVAGITAALAPMFLGITATLNTTTFEPLAWTFVAYAIARAVILDDRRALIWGGVVAGVAMEAKYALPAWLIALAIGLACTSERRMLARRELWIGMGIAVLIALPSVIWQAAHHFPFAELVHNAGDKDVRTPVVAFLLNQVMVFNPLFAPIWIAGLIAPFAMRDLRQMRFVSIAYVVVAAIIIAGGWERLLPRSGVRTAVRNRCRRTRTRRSQCDRTICVYGPRRRAFRRDHAVTVADPLTAKHGRVAKHAAPHTASARKGRCFRPPAAIPRHARLARLRARSRNGVRLIDARRTKHDIDHGR